MREEEDVGEFPPPAPGDAAYVDLLADALQAAPKPTTVQSYNVGKSHCGLIGTSLQGRCWSLQPEKMVLPPCVLSPFS